MYSEWAVLRDYSLVVVSSCCTVACLFLQFRVFAMLDNTQHVSFVFLFSFELQRIFQIVTSSHDNCSKEIHIVGCLTRRAGIPPKEFSAVVLLQRQTTSTNFTTTLFDLLLFWCIPCCCCEWWWCWLACAQLNSTPSVGLALSLTPITHYTEGRMETLEAGIQFSNRQRRL